MTRVGAYKSSYGYSYRKCPYSQSYKEAFYVEGYNGNSTNPNLPIPDGQITIHTTTSGNMFIHSRGGVYGFICLDDDCYFYTTYGYRYFEI